MCIKNTPKNKHIQTRTKPTPKIDFSNKKKPQKTNT